MASVGAEDPVVGGEQVRLTYRGTFLTDGQVSRTGMLVLHAVVVLRGLDGVDHGLKLTDDLHVAVDAQEIFFGVVGLLVFDGLVVLVYRDVLEFHPAGLAYDVFVNKL